MNVTANLKQAENTQIKRVIFIGVLQPVGDYFSVLFLMLLYECFPCRYVLYELQTNKFEYISSYVLFKWIFSFFTSLFFIFRE